MHVPDDLRYSKDHEWVSVEAGAGRVRIGITDYAQDALGDVVFVQLPAVGTVVEVNAELAEAPQHLNEDPYGAGWICAIEPSTPAALDDLLDAAAYSTLINS